MAQAGVLVAATPSAARLKRREVPGWAVTAALVVVTLVGVPTGIAWTGGSVTPDGALPLAQALALLVLLRRRWPVAALLAAVAAVGAFRSAGLVDVGWVWPATVAFAHVAAVGRAGWAVGIGITFLAHGATWETSVEGRSLEWVAGRVGAETLWLALVLAAGVAYRNWRRWQDELAARQRQAVHERELEARRRRAEERVRIAHELHDVVSHTLAVVGVHLNVALDTIESDPDEARDALRLAQEVRGRAMTDLKALVGVLHSGFERGIETPAAQLDDLTGLLEQVRAAGIEVMLQETGDSSTVPAPVALASYRVVQEALTNVVRHARATRATVRLSYEPAQVTVTVTDNGIGADADAAGGGHGISGMRERVSALGGSLQVGPIPGGGFTIRAAIPVAG